MNDYNSNKNKYISLTLLLLIIVLVILFFGLKPLKWQISNDAILIPAINALKFNNHGIAYVDNLRSYNAKESADAFTIHINTTTNQGKKQGFRPMLMIHSGDDQHQLSIWNWGHYLIAMNGDDYDNTQKIPRISARGVFNSRVSQLISISSGKQGTKIFINGELVREKKKLRLTIPDNIKKRRLTLGNSVYGKHGWEGEITGFALYGKALSENKIKDIYNQWLSTKAFSPDVTDDNQLLFTFKENNLGKIADQSGHNQHLLLPKRLIPLKKTFLTPPWINFTPNKTFLIDTSLNLIGFIPLGVVFLYWLQQFRPLGNNNRTIVLLFGFLLSLLIEITQGWLPDRTSSLSDLFLNTLGTWVGIIIIHHMLQQE